MSNTKAPPARHYRSGFCNAGNPLDSHDRCPGSYKGTACECDTVGCPCMEARLQGAIMCGPDDPTDDDLRVVAQFADALRIPDETERAAAMLALSHDDTATTGSVATVVQHHATATANGTPVEVTVTGERWTWEADAAAELMLDHVVTCPMCQGEWPDHLYLDDGRVACP